MDDATTAQQIVREIEHSIDVVRIRKLVHDLAQMVPGYQDPTQDITVVTYKQDKRFELVVDDEVISFGELDALDLAIVQAHPCRVVRVISGPETTPTE